MNLISEQELTRFGKTWSMSGKAIALVNQQKATWQLAKENYRSLKNLQTRMLDFGDFHLVCHYNPGRIRSSAANTSAEAILSRLCFLCDENRPHEQLGIPYKEDYIILTNPYPIFPYHLTISSIHHTPQMIEGNLRAFMEMGRDLNEFTIFYNGPRCGASAPDHLHFQAGIRGILTLEDDLELLLKNHSVSLIDSQPITVRAVDDDLRRFIYFCSSDLEPLVFSLTGLLAMMENGDGEPMLNIINWFNDGKWHVLLFPRVLQRPWQYFAEDPVKIVISPAAVELGGIIVLPREADFQKIRASDLISVFDQITITREDFKVLQHKFIAGGFREP